MIPRTFRGTARISAFYAIAGLAYFSAIDLLLAKLGPAVPGADYFNAASDLVFVIGSVLLLGRLTERQYRRLRRVNESLEARAANRAEDLRHEVAERARAEAALRTSEQRFRDIAEAAAEWIWEMGPDLHFHTVSKRFSEVTGCPVESLVGRTAAELLDTPGLMTEGPAGRRPFRDAPATLKTPVGERQLLLSGRPVVDAAGAFLGYRGTGSDITERRGAERSTQRLRRRQELILDCLGEGVFGLDRMGRFTFINPAAQAILGWTMAELAGRLAEDTLQPGGLASEGTDSHRRTGARFRRKDGSWLPVDFVWTAVMEDGQRSGAVVAFVDVTERQRIEAELMAAKDSAEAATRAKSDFLAHMSHELRTPLNSIIGFADVMAGEYFGPIGNARYKDYVGDIRRSGEHLRDLINDVVDLSRIEAGKLVLDEKPCDVAELVDEALTMVRPLATEGGCSLLNNVPGNLPAVILDARRFKQILLNLLSNAVKFTPRGGRISVMAEMSAEGGVMVRVADSGIGIPAEELNEITQVFVQGNNAVAREKGGAGLGLPLAKQLVELHGGRLEIASQIHQGTTVTLDLPPSRLAGSNPGHRQRTLVKHGAD